MFPSSSIFSFRGGRYLAVFGGALFATIGGLAAISYYGLTFGVIDHPYQQNYRFQLHKIASSPPVETLFVGDSSLGAMMDSEVWARASGHASLHLALTGSDGYAGSLNMARRSIDRLRPRNLVIVHTLDMMTREVAYVGFLQTNPDPEREQDVPLYSRIFERFQLLVSREFVIGTLRGLAGKAEPRMGNEYIRLPDVAGAPRESAPGRLPVLGERDINLKKVIFLKQLGDLCRSRNLNCVYAHGPLYEAVCRTSAAYINAVRKRVETAGLRVVVETPVCVPLDELGDTIDHVRQDLKPIYTRRYYERIRPYLQDAKS